MRFSWAARAAVAAVLLLTLGPHASAQELPEALQPSFAEGVAALRAGKLDAAMRVREAKEDFMVMVVVSPFAMAVPAVACGCNYLG